MKAYLFLILILVFASCNNDKGTLQSDEKKFKVEEVIQANSYTYFKVKENSKQRWVAVTKTIAKKGDVFYYDKELQMKKFHSKDLDRTFDEVYFVNQISKTPFSDEKGVPPHLGKVQTPLKKNLNIEKEDGELTIAEIFDNSTEYSHKEIEIRGTVVKVNEGVMGKNWVHIQDGSKSGDNYDLTITTGDLPAVNDEVIFKGVVSLNKDFGSGYYYDVILEDAEWVNKEMGLKL